MQATVESRTLFTNQGEAVDTPLTDAEAVTIAARIRGSSFAQSLVSKAGRYKLTPAQLAWLHKLALRQLEAELAAQDGEQPPQGIPNADLKRLNVMFDQAAQDRAYSPKVVLRTEVGQVMFSRCMKGTNVGTVWVTNGAGFRNPANRLYGGIKDGVFRKHEDTPAWVVELVEAFAANPEGVAGELGRLTGNCCFCRQPLDNEQSQKLGYGPVCAARYGLRHQY